MATVTCEKIPLISSDAGSVEALNDATAASVSFPAKARMAETGKEEFLQILI
jgi:hypothetical protein